MENNNTQCGCWVKDIMYCPICKKDIKKGKYSIIQSYSGNEIYICDKCGSELEKKKKLPIS